jgi:hypothetical protein
MNLTPNRPLCVRLWYREAVEAADCMAKQGLVPANNQQHKVSALLVEGRSSLRALARVYFVTEVAGQAPATIDAKRRDATWPLFFTFYAKLYGHDQPEEW